MPRRIAIIFLAIIISPFGIKCHAETTPAEVLACPPSALDVYALPPTDSSPVPSRHLLVFEVQNIGKTVCSIDSPMIQLLPKLSRRDEFNSTKYLPDGSSEDGSFDRTVLSPGDWVHTLVGWQSQGHPNWQCVEHSGLKLLLTHQNRGTEPVAEASVEVRNLLTRSCILVSVSEYRNGRYTSDSAIPDDWLKFPLADPSERPSSLKQTTYLQILHNSILLGRDFQIRLKREVQPGNGCDYRLLRMRDSDGTTVISLQNCEEITTRLSQGLINLFVLNSSPEELS
jgi:hypothetical protein